MFLHPTSFISIWMSEGRREPPTISSMYSFSIHSKPCRNCCGRYNASVASHMITKIAIDRHMARYTSSLYRSIGETLVLTSTSISHETILHFMEYQNNSKLLLVLRLSLILLHLYVIYDRISYVTNHGNSWPFCKYIFTSPRCNFGPYGNIDCNFMPFYVTAGLSFLQTSKYGLNNYFVGSYYNVG